MKTKLTGWLALLCFALTLAWLALLIAGMSQAGPLDTFERVLAYVQGAGAAFTLTYLNAALITITAVMLYSLLYLYCQPAARQWALIGLAFVPMYGVLNLLVYLSQITILPQLMQLRGLPGYQPAVDLALRQAIQAWPASAVAMANNLAYALLGIPSIIYGALMAKTTPALRLGGVLLGLNGAACIAGFAGLLAQIPWLSQGSLIGGVLFLLALAPVSRTFLRKTHD